MLPPGLPGREEARKEQRHLPEVWWSLFREVLVGDAPAGSLGCFGTDWGRRGHATWETAVTAFVTGEHWCGATSSQPLLSPWPGGCRSVACPAASVLCERGYRVRWGCVPPALAGLRRTRGRYHFVDSSCPSVSLLYCLGSNLFFGFFVFFLMKTD